MAHRKASRPDSCLSCENAFCAFAESFADPIIVAGEKGTITFCNTALQTALGYAGGELLDKPVESILAHYNIESSRAVENKNLPSDEDRYSLIINAAIRHKNGGCLSAEVTICPLRAGGCYRLVLVCRFAARPGDTAGRNAGSAARLSGTEACRPEQENSTLIGQSPAIRRVREMIAMVAGTDSGVLITGESGTGKELVAEELHRASNRSHRPLVKLHCSALPETLLESELFGHVRGSFTGAIKDAPGRFQAADGGTLFLDEIGDISPALQVKLLRVLQNREFNRIGESTPVRVDVRIIAATNQDLGLLMQQKLFREDLYYRLKVFEINVPPLRERAEDIPLLVDCFLSALYGKCNKEDVIVTDSVMKLFTTYRWPGNIRELAHAIEHAFIICTNGKISLHHLPLEIQKSRIQGGTSPAPPCRQEADRLREALCKTGGNKARAARILGIDRKTLYRQLKKHHITYLV